MSHSTSFMELSQSLADAFSQFVQCGMCCTTSSQHQAKSRSPPFFFLGAAFVDFHLVQFGHSYPFSLLLTFLKTIANLTKFFVVVYFKSTRDASEKN